MKRNVEVITRAEWQGRLLKLPKGDVSLGDGRVLRRVIGYDLSKIKLDKHTADSFLASGGWHHKESGFVVSAGIEKTVQHGPLLHVSMSYQDHDPSWDEIKLVRDFFFPATIDAAMLLPRQGNYVNVHPHCFHLWQLQFPWEVG